MKKENVFAEYALIFLGTFLMGFAIKDLYDPVNLVTGGFTGIAIILKNLFSLPLWVTNTLLNVPVFLIAVPVLGWKFVKRTLFATAGLSLALLVIPENAFLKDDILLSCLAGGVLNGVGIGFVFVSQATTGGTDLLAALLNKRIRHRSLVEIMEVMDGAIVLLGISVFGIRPALYAVIAIFVVAKVSDAMIEGLKFSKQAFIISDRSSVIADKIMEKMDRGVTGIQAKGMYTGDGKQMLFCVVPKKEISMLKDLVAETDPDAFVIVSDAREVFGEGFLGKNDKIIQ
jgi:uncharacterized membrane-anchored protein YitT (DUF2179 family)